MQRKRKNLQQSCHYPTLKKFPESWEETLLTKDTLSVLTGDTIRDILSLPTDSDSLTKLHALYLWMTFWRRTRDMYDFYHKKMMTSKAVKVVSPTDNLQSQQLLQFYYSSASSLCQVLTKRRENWISVLQMCQVCSKKKAMNGVELVTTEPLLCWDANLVLKVWSKP